MPLDVEALYRRYGLMVLCRCRSLVGEDEAEDAMQDVFVQVVRHGHRLHDGAPSSLLLRIATRVCLNRLRTRRRHPEDRDPDLLARIACAPDERGMARRVLDRVFADEPESTRVLAVLHLVDGFTLQEVADQVGLSVSGVRKRLRTLQAHVAELEGVSHG